MGITLSLVYSSLGRGYHQIFDDTGSLLESKYTVKNDAQYRELPAHINSGAWAVAEGKVVQAAEITSSNFRN